LWYLSVVPEIRDYLMRIEGEPEVIRERCKSALYDFFEERLRNSAIFLGESLASADAERKRIDTVVIHHTSQPPGMRPIRLSAIELIRLYATYFESRRRLPTPRTLGGDNATEKEGEGGTVDKRFDGRDRRGGLGFRFQEAGALRDSIGALLRCPDDSFESPNLGWIECVDGRPSVPPETTSNRAATFARRELGGGPYFV
jgi:hypothetical protein